MSLGASSEHCDTTWGARMEHHIKEGDYPRRGAERLLLSLTILSPILGDNPVHNHGYVIETSAYFRGFDRLLHF